MSKLDASTSLPNSANNKRQADARFRRAEFDLKQKCLLNGVEYEGPSPTESTNKTKVRRALIRRKIYRINDDVQHPINDQPPQQQKRQLHPQEPVQEITQPLTPPLHRPQQPPLHPINDQPQQQQKRQLELQQPQQGQKQISIIAQKDSTPCLQQQQQPPPPSVRSLTMLVELDEEHTKCGICIAKFSSDRDNKNPEIRKHLPVLSSSQRCDHWFCHGCILREQLRIAEENNGKIPKWIKCMHCREKTSFNPDRLLIDLLARAQKYAAAQVKAEQTEVEENETTDVTPVKQEQNNEFHEGHAASEGKVNGEGDDADDDVAASVKRESDTTDHVEQEVKRPKLMTPSPPLVRVKEEPTEFDDDYDEATSLERRTPINRIDSASTYVLHLQNG